MLTFRGRLGSKFFPPLSLAAGALGNSDNLYFMSETGTLQSPPSPPLAEIRLCNFRCFPSLAFHPGPETTFLVGRNAQGKTSLLEAICLLTRLQSPRTSTLARTIRFDSPEASLDGIVAGRHLRFRWGGGGRRLELDSLPQSGSEEYLRVQRVSWFSNDDRDLVRGSGSGRRRFLDFLGAQTKPGYLRSLRNYERALRSRNFLLKTGRPWKEIESYDAVLEENGHFLTESRKELVEEMGPFLQDAVRGISGNRETLECRFAYSYTGRLGEAFRENREEDERIRQTGLGPHREDLILTLQGRPAGTYASEGQQRTAALALRIAQTNILQQRTGSLPLLLLDDVFGELDPDRRSWLLDVLPREAQKIITTTTLNWRTPEGLVVQIYELHNGALQESDGRQFQFSP